MPINCLKGIITLTQGITLGQRAQTSECGLKGQIKLTNQYKYGTVSIQTICTYGFPYKN